jgi:hypothetical protein
VDGEIGGPLSGRKLEVCPIFVLGNALRGAQFYRCAADFTTGTPAYFLSAKISALDAFGAPIFAGTPVHGAD